MLRDVELELAQLLDAAGLGSISSSPPSIYAGPFPESAPDQMLSVEFIGGANSDDYSNAGLRLFSPELEITVRGAPGQYKAALDLALAAFWALHLPAGTTYSEIKAQGAGPLYQGQDESGRHTFHFDVVASYTVNEAAP